MKRGAPRALRLKQSGSLPPLFLDNSPPSSSLLLSSSARHSNFSPNNDHRGKPVQKVWRKKKDTSCLLFPTFPFSLWSDKGSRAIDEWRYVNHNAECLSRFWTLLSNAPKSQAKGSSVCIEESCRQWVYGLGGDKVLWRGPVLG